MQYVIGQLSLVAGSGRQRAGGRKNQFIAMLPAETAGDGGFETDVLGGIPLVEQGIFYQGLAKPEHEVAQLGHFIVGIGIVERYGMTETLITVSTRADGERRPGWVGHPIVGVQSRLVDDTGSVIAHDGETIGELQIRGSTMFDEYLNRPDATSASMDGDWFKTGDAAVIDAGGFHRIVGRQSVDIIKTGGFKVGAGEVEAALLTHPGVAEAAVIGVQDADLGQRIVAYVVCREVDDATLINHVAALLSVHKRPREVRIVEVLPRNAMGKVQKSLLT